MSTVTQAKIDYVNEAFMNGFYDEVTGDSEAPTGHVVRVGAMLVVTDQLGFHHLTEYDTEESAKADFAEIADAYSAWDSGEGDL